MFRYTFSVKGWNTRTITNIVKEFKEKLNMEETHRELGFLFDAGIYKSVMVSNVVQVDENGNIVNNIDWKKW